jgi:hypothetical protein
VVAGTLKAGQQQEGDLESNGGRADVNVKGSMDGVVQLGISSLVQITKCALAADDSSTHTAILFIDHALQWHPKCMQLHVLPEAELPKTGIRGS